VSDKTVAARVLRDVAKMPVEDIATLFSVDISTIYRWLEKEAEAHLHHDAGDAIEALLAKQTLDEVGDTSAALARGLAMKIDKASASDVAADSMALPALVKELRAVIAEIVGASEDDKQWLANVFSTVGHAEDAESQDARAAGRGDSGGVGDALHAVAADGGGRGDGDRFEHGETGL
jgi:hypothetical protein